MQKEIRNKPSTASAGKAHRIKAVFFDAVGTLIQAEPSAAAVYAEVGRRHGSAIDVNTIRREFHAALARQEALDRRNGWRTSEARELERWRTIVGEVLSDVPDVERCFLELYEHFACAGNWRCDPAAAGVLEQLYRQGLVVGLASNFDQRLRQVAAGLPALCGIRHIVLSAEVGWRKPAPAFFVAVGQASVLPPQETLYVGDDRVNDYEGARAMGFEALLIDPHAEEPAQVRRIAGLAEVLEVLE
jgi:putative hydrolase of the HAD superfamily